MAKVKSQFSATYDIHVGDVIAIAAEIHQDLALRHTRNADNPHAQLIQMPCRLFVAACTNYHLVMPSPISFCKTFH